MGGIWLMFSATNHHSGVPFVVVLLSQLQEGSRGCLTARSTLLCAQGPLMPPPAGVGSTAKAWKTLRSAQFFVSCPVLCACAYVTTSRDQTQAASLASLQVRVHVCAPNNSSNTVMKHLSSNATVASH